MTTILVEFSNALADAAAHAGASTALVNARPRLPGSGIVIAADLVLTANHVIEREEGITVRLDGADALNAALAGRDPGTDLAVLRLEQPAAVVAQPAQTARVGQLVLALGRPSSAGIEASLGVISAIGGPVRTPRGSLEQTIRTDAVPYPGFSGGPLVDAEGRVVGLNTSGFGPGAVLTIPAALAWRIGRQLAEHGSIKRGYLGIRSQVVRVPEAARSNLGHTQKTGLLVLSVEPGSPAETGGLMVGDLLVALDGQPLEDQETLFARLSAAAVGQPLALQILRGGQPVQLVVQAGARA